MAKFFKNSRNGDFGIDFYEFFDTSIFHSQTFTADGGKKMTRAYPIMICKIKGQQISNNICWTNLMKNMVKIITGLLNK